MLTPTPRRKPRRIATVVALAVALGVSLVAPVVAAGPAVAAPGGDITGTVTAADGGAGLSDIDVQLLEYDAGAQSWFFDGESTTTDGSGGYDLATPSDGAFRVSFADPSGQYVSEYWDDAQDADSATDVDVSSGGTTSGIDAALALAAHITGTVKDTGHAGLPDVDVSVLEYDPTAAFWSEVAAGTTDASGDYDIGGLPAGTYRIGFVPNDGRLSEYWDDQPTLETASDVVVAGGEVVSGKDATLVHGSHLTGTVTAAAGGAPLDQAVVVAYVFDPFLQDWSFANSALTDASGDYDIDGLRADTYRVEFIPDGSALLPEFWNDEPDLDSADGVILGAEATEANIDAGLAAAAHVTGTVTGPGGPLVNVTATAYRHDAVSDQWVYAGEDFTNAAGSYDIGGLAADTYRIGFERSPSYLAEFWNDKPTVDTADSIVVAAGANVGGKDAVLASASHITGAVSFDGGDIVPVEVSAYQDLGGGDFAVVGQTTSDAGDGTYDLGGLPAGTYRLGFSDPSGTYLDEFWDDEPTVDAATDIVVGSDATVAGKDATLALGGHVTGSVTEVGGAGLEGISVDAYLQSSMTSTWDLVGGAVTDVNGDYQIDGLPTGSYRIGFSDVSGGHVDEYYDDKATLDAATSVAVTAGSSTPGIDAQLDVAGHITGTVTASGGAALENVDVTAWRNGTDGWEPVSFDTTGPFGGYDLGGLATGSYRVEFDDGAHAREYWDDKPDLDSADAIAVTSGVTTSGKDAVLGVGGSIAGRVTDQANAGIEADVTVYRKKSDNSFVEYAYGYAATGDYVVGGLPAGTYRLEFTPYAAGLSGEFYDDRPTLDASTDVVVGAGSSVTGRNAVLTASGPSSSVVNTALPAVGGTAQVGQTLTATAGSWLPGDATTSFEWLSNGVAIAGAVASTYHPVAGDVGKTISVRVTAAKVGYTSGTATSAPTAPVVAAGVTPPPPPPPAAVAMKVSPKISGTALVGKKLKVSAGTWDPGGVTLTYQWYAGSKAVKGATGTSFKLTSKQVGKKMTVKVTAAASGYLSTTATSAPSGKVKPKPKKPKRLGIPRVALVARELQG